MTIITAIAGSKHYFAKASARPDEAQEFGFTIALYPNEFTQETAFVKTFEEANLLSGFKSK